MRTDRPHAAAAALLAALPLALAACPPPRRPSPSAGARPASPGSAQAKASASAAPPAAAAVEFPTACARAGEVCSPDEAFVEAVCKAQVADAALVLFGKGSPWTRGYLTRDTEAWNASGGGTARGKLLFDEEVIVLRKRAASGIVVGQGGGFDVIRWDGSCVTLAAEELTLKRPPRVRAAPIGWRNLNTPARDALLADAKVSALYDKRRKECKGATSGDVSAACVKAESALDAGIVAFVRDGGSVPPPKLP